MTQVSKIIPEEIQIALKEGRKILLEHEAKNLVSRYGIPVTKIQVARNEEEAVKIAERIGFP
ncbi:MAG: acetyl-CoA synthetase, partial [Thermoproteota archaeon]